MNLELTYLTMLLASEFQGQPVSVSSMLGLQVHAGMPNFLFVC